jgi:hypothetical protein
MDDEIKLQKYRKLSLASLVTGILSIAPAILYNFLWMFITKFLSEVIGIKFLPNIIMPLMAIGVCLAIAAIICGSIDLKKIKQRFYSNKGKGLDIAGIVMGGVVILGVVILMLGEIIIPH